MFISRTNYLKNKPITIVSIQGDVMSDIWQQEKNLTKAAKILGESKSHLHLRESTTKTKVIFN